MKTNEWDKFKQEILAQYEDSKPQLPAVDWERVYSNLSLPQVSIIEKSLPESVLFAILFLAGQGSGKTFLLALISARYIADYPEARGLIAANTKLQLNDITLSTIRKVWRELLAWKEYNPATGEGCYTVGIIPPSHFDTSKHDFKEYDGVISFANGAVVFYRSLENYEPIDGLDLNWAVLDETKDTKPEAITEVILGRLRRATEGFKNKLILSTSPAKSEFLTDWFALNDFEAEINRMIFSKETFFQEETTEGKFVVISSVYHNEKNLEQGFIERQFRELPQHLHGMLIFGSPFMRNGGEFYKQFNREKHTGTTQYNLLLPLHVSVDFNVKPYMTFTIWQFEGNTAYQIDEICAESPHNNTPAICALFIKKYPNHEGGLFIHGDPSGKKSDTRNEEGYNDYTIIESKLSKYRPINKVASKAPPVVKRGEFVNAIFENELYGIKIVIDKKCTASIADYTFLKEAGDGTKLKERVKVKGVVYEKYGHPSDANDYVLCAVFKPQFEKYKRGDKPRRNIITGSYNKRNR